MSCSSCGSHDGSKPKGCNSNGGCSTGGCNKMNTYDWLSELDIHDPHAFAYHEVSFKFGQRKNFFKSNPANPVDTGDMVLVEAATGYDIGRVSLSGELVRMQMKKKRVEPESIMHSIIRPAYDRDLEKVTEGRKQEKQSLIRARAIARSLKLDMKIGDVEYQGDKRKATFYYIADGRVDFRELIRIYANEFKVKIEMRQIGARQESALVGGMGSCGRELCCSTWLTDFKSVNTSAARYQNLAINQSKLSGQCGRLKCCLNYELDHYLEALDEFPQHADRLKTKNGTAILVKTDIFRKLMFYSYEQTYGRSVPIPIPVASVKEMLQRIRKGEIPESLELEKAPVEVVTEQLDFENVQDVIQELPVHKKKKNKKKPNKNRPQGGSNPPQQGNNSNPNPGPKPNPNQNQSGPRPPQSGHPPRHQRRPPRKDGPQ